MLLCCAILIQRAAPYVHEKCIRCLMVAKVLELEQMCLRMYHLIHRTLNLAWISIFSDMNSFLDCTA